MSRRRIASSPLATKARLSPLSGTTSATVPSATRSSRSSRSGSGRAVVPEAAPAQLAVHRHHGHEHQPDRGEMAELGEIIEPVRIHHRQRGRQRLVGEMMVDDDRLHAEPRRFRQRLVADGAAIDGDQQRRAARRERADRLDVRPVAFEEAVGDMDDRIDAADAAGSAPASPPRSRRRRRSRRRSRPSRGARWRRRSAPPPRPCPRARSDRASARARSGRDRPRHVVDLDAPAGQHPRQQVRQAVALRDRQRPRRAALVEPVAPGAAGRGLLDAEEMAALAGNATAGTKGLDKTDNIGLPCGRISSPIVRNSSPQRHAHQGVVEWPVWKT